jgi:hypothetical protein
MHSPVATLYTFIVSSYDPVTTYCHCNGICDIVFTSSFINVMSHNFTVSSLHSVRVRVAFTNAREITKNTVPCHHSYLLTSLNISHHYRAITRPTEDPLRLPVVHDGPDIVTVTSVSADALTRQLIPSTVI